MLGAFVDAALDLVKDGADGITTNCGFLSVFQKDLSEAIPVPVATSSLMQVEMVNRTLPAGKRAGILTISAKSLTNAHLAAVGVPLSTPIRGVDGSHFSRTILSNHSELDRVVSQSDLVQGAVGSITSHPDTDVIVLECTNMPPYQRDIEAATGRPVVSILDAINDMQRNLSVSN